MLNFQVGYKTLNEKSVCNLNAQVKAFLPRKYVTDDMFKGLWMVDGIASIAINKKIIGVMPSIGFSFRRDYIPVIKNEILD